MSSYLADFFFCAGGSRPNMSPGHTSFSAQVQVFATTPIYCLGPPLWSIHSEMEPDSASSHTGENPSLKTIIANCCNVYGYCAYAIQLTSTVSLFT